MNIGMTIIKLTIENVKSYHFFKYNKRPDLIWTYYRCWFIQGCIELYIENAGLTAWRNSG